MRFEKSSPDTVLITSLYILYNVPLQHFIPQQSSRKKGQSKYTLGRIQLSVCRKCCVSPRNSLHIVGYV